MRKTIVRHSQNTCDLSWVGRVRKVFFFFKCFEFTGMHTVMKYFRYDMRCIDDRWNLNALLKVENRRWSKRLSENVLNVTTFSSWGG